MTCNITATIAAEAIYTVVAVVGKHEGKHYSEGAIRVAITAAITAVATVLPIVSGNDSSDRNVVSGNAGDGDSGFVVSPYPRIRIKRQLALLE